MWRFDWVSWLASIDFYWTVKVNQFGFGSTIYLIGLWFPANVLMITQKLITKEFFRATRFGIWTRLMHFHRGRTIIFHVCSASQLVQTQNRWSTSEWLVIDNHIFNSLSFICCKYNSMKYKHFLLAIPVDRIYHLFTRLSLGMSYNWNLSIVEGEII